MGGLIKRLGRFPEVQVRTPLLVAEQIAADKKSEDLRGKIEGKRAPVLVGMGFLGKRILEKKRI